MCDVPKGASGEEGNSCNSGNTSEGLKRPLDNDNRHVEDPPDSVKKRPRGPYDCLDWSDESEEEFVPYTQSYPSPVKKVFAKKSSGKKVVDKKLSAKKSTSVKSSSKKSSTGGLVKSSSKKSSTGDLVKSSSKKATNKSSSKNAGSIRSMLEKSTTTSGEIVS